MVKFEVSGILQAESRDGKTWYRVDYLGGSLGVVVGKQVSLPAGVEGTFVGEVRKGLKGNFFLVTGQK